MISVVIAVVICAVVFTSVIVVLVIIIFVLKKKHYGKKEEQTDSEHNYESIPPSSIRLKPLSSDKEKAKSIDDSNEEDVTYEEIASSPATVKIENEAYTCTSFKPSDESATDEL